MPVMCASLARRTGSLLALLLAACPQPPPPPPPDAGPDTSCGLDCAAQERYGLILNRCFEYSTTSFPANPAELGVLVSKAPDLEGGLKVLQLEYLQSGQIRMTDAVTIKEGVLLLARRTFLPGQSVTYRDASGKIVGAKWLTLQTGAGESLVSSAQADVQGSGPKMEPTSYRVTTAQPTASELSVPLQRFDTGVKLLFSETPDHGADPRRVFVPGTGFVLFSSYFSPLVSGTAQEYRLQRIRDLGTPDAGSAECGFGSP